jgi:hypothetical protein
MNGLLSPERLSAQTTRTCCAWACRSALSSMARWGVVWETATALRRDAGLKLRQEPREGGRAAQHAVRMTATIPLASVCGWPLDGVPLDGGAT